METEKIYKLVSDSGITLDFFPMQQSLSAAVDLGGKYFVGIDPAVLASPALERVCLAHELGHCQTGSTYNFYSPLDIRAKHERRANDWAVRLLVPKAELEAAIKNGYRDIPSLAEYFSVTEDFMKKVIEYYRKAVIV